MNFRVLIINIYNKVVGVLGGFYSYIYSSDFRELREIAKGSWAYAAVVWEYLRIARVNYRAGSYIIVVLVKVDLGFLDSD